MYGEVVGISTRKLTKKNTSGIGFALSAPDLVTVLRPFYPDAHFAPPETVPVSTDNSGEAPVAPRDSALPSQAAQPAAPEGAGTLEVLKGNKTILKAILDPAP